MNYLLICPGSKARIQMPGALPLPLIPMFGQTLLEYWLSHFAKSGAREVMVLADTALEEISRLVGAGERWGIKAQVQSESRELTVAQACLKYAGQLAGNDSNDAVVLLDHFPGCAGTSLLDSYATFYEGLEKWITQANTPDRVGYRELRPGIWVGSQARVSPLARLEAPCWIGRHARVEAHAVIGPGAIIEDGAVIDQAAEIYSSQVGPRTYVGKFGSICESLAWGGTLLNWRTASMVQVPDPFLLCALRTARQEGPGMLAKLGQVYSRNKLDAQMLWKQLVMNREG